MSIAALFFVTIAASANSEQGGEYGSPVDFTITLAGNLGEIRSDHFHSGIDIKALRGVGSPILASRSGYVSRIGVSPTGYGNVLYVTHEDGDVTVYGHLDAFSTPIARWVEKQQYAKQSYTVDLYPTAQQFPVNRGQQIAKLGNSGSSGGPHLHFEIRKAGMPSNMIADGTFEVADHLTPTISRVLLFEVDTIGGLPVHRLSESKAVTRNVDGTCQMADTIPFNISSRGYFAYEVIDYKDGRTNTMGVYSLRQLVDGQLNFSFRIDKIDFATTRYINTFVSYAENRASKYSVIRAYVSPNNRLRVYDGVRARGVISPPYWGDISMVETTVCDDAGNSAALHFFVKRAEYTAVATTSARGVPVVWSQDKLYSDSICSVSIPRGSLYESALLDIHADTTLGGVVVVGSADIPLQSAIKVAVRCDTLSASLRHKALLVSVSNDGSKRSGVGGVWSDQLGGVEASVRRMGRFAVGVDTLSPRVSSALKSGGTLAPGRSLRFSVSDDLSGIDKWRLEVDSEWALSSYDPRTKQIEYLPKRTAEPTMHQVKLTVTDAKGNRATHSAKYIW